MEELFDVLLFGRALDGSDAARQSTKMVDCPWIVDNVVIANLLSNPHGRRMLCGMLYLDFPESKSLATGFFRVFREMDGGAEKESIRHLMAGAPLRAAFASNLLAGKMVDKKALPNSGEWIRKAVQPAQGNLFNSDSLDLASPVFGSDILTEAFHMTGASEDAKAILSTNENFPDTLKRKRWWPPRRLLVAEAAALAKYGNLQDPAVAKKVTRWIATRKPSGEIFSAKAGDQIAHEGRKLLCERRDVPEDVLLALLNGADFDEYSMLAKTDGYKAIADRLVDEKAPAEQFIKGNALFLSSKTDAGTLDALYGVISRRMMGRPQVVWDRHLALVAAHPNADPRLLERAPDDGVSPATLCGAVLTMRPAGAESFLAGMVEHTSLNEGALAKLPDCSAETLAACFDKAVSRQNNSGEAGLEWDNRIRLASHKNFPWSRYSFQEMCDSVNKQNLPVLYCCMALNASYPEVDSMCKAGAFCALFNLRTSSRDLQKLVQRDERMAPLVAAHPNGDSFADQSEEMKPLISKFEPIPLAGRGTKGVEEKPYVLEID